jgi:hypothetical protein
MCLAVLPGFFYGSDLSFPYVYFIKRLFQIVPFDYFSVLIHKVTCC